VSSAAIKSTSLKVFRARADISERLPIGVAAMYNEPGDIFDISVYLPDKKTAAILNGSFFGFDIDYSEIASTGHELTQAPQSIHASLISYWEPPSEIASTGHSLTHAPQEMHSLLIL